jgi:Domain of unknown function (DUF4760)
MDSSTIFSFNLTVRIGIALTVAVFLATGLFWDANDNWRSIIIFFGAATLAAGQIAVAFYAARTLRQAADVEEKRLAVSIGHEKTLKETIGYEFASRWTDASMFHIRKAFQEVLEKGMREKDKASDFIDEDVGRRANVGNLLNFLENMALSVNSERCDDQVAKKLFCGIVINCWGVTNGWIAHQRVSRGRPQLWIELETLHKRWSS